MIDPSARRPLYRQLADDLHQRITAGQFPPGPLLPSEPDLGHEYQVGQHTIRAALDLLVHRGLVIKRHGARTRVRDTPVMSVAQYPPGHRVGARPATDAERAEHELPPGAWILVVVEADTGLEVDVFPADRWRLEQGHPEE
jgi:DNA-binding transcriptional MocR family regulator